MNDSSPDSGSVRAHQAVPGTSFSPTRSPNVSLTRGDFLDGDNVASGDEPDLNKPTRIHVSGSRNTRFHELFPNIPKGDYLIEDYGCVLQREILIHGRLYISKNHICFHANIFGWITILSMPFREITRVIKKVPGFNIPDALQIRTSRATYTFTSLLSRETTSNLIADVWRLGPPGDALELEDIRSASTRDTAVIAMSVSEGSGGGFSVTGGNKVALSVTDTESYKVKSTSSFDELDLNGQYIPVTRDQRNEEFHELFPGIFKEDYLIEDYSCALQREVLVRGQLYISKSHICFYANSLGWITNLSIPMHEITRLEKAVVFGILDAIQVTTSRVAYTLTTFVSRDTAYDIIANAWQPALPHIFTTFIVY